MPGQARIDMAAVGIDVHGRLHHAIVCGELRPNSRLVEAELADWLHVSRTPVRESLQRLAQEGLVDNERRGWTVHEHSAAEIREIYDVRAALEGFAARLAAERRSPEQADEIVRSGAHDSAVFLPPPRTGFVEYNERFHDLVVAAGANRRLVETIRRTRAYYFNHRIAAVYSAQEVVEASEGHRAIADAVRRGDGDAAERFTREHVYIALELAVNKL